MSTEFQELWDKAWAAGVEAATALTPVPMTLGTAIGFSREIDPSKPVYYEPEGVCGFAEVRIKPATSKFAKWLMANDHAKKSHQGGIYVWISDYNQSMQRKEAHAYAMADVLKAAGINCWAQSRMD